MVLDSDSKSWIKGPFKVKITYWLWFDNHHEPNRKVKYNFEFIELFTVSLWYIIEIFFEFEHCLDFNSISVE